MKTKNTILIVDDIEINRFILKEMLIDNYNVLEASDGVEAVSILKKEYASISLVLLDILMPNLDGFEVLKIMNEQKWLDDIPVIMISADKKTSSINKAYNLGASEFINRPFDSKIVNRRIENTILMYSKQKWLKNLALEQFLQKEKNSSMMIEILSHIVEFRNGESGQHIIRIRLITEELLKQLTLMTKQYNIDSTKILLITNASALHDIGKISIPEEILNKPGKLTTEEFEIMKTHCDVGHKMIEKIAYYKNEPLVIEAKNICRWHHERYDGRGYPDGLKGEEIPISAQVVAIADVYDALTSKRAYKPAFSHEQSIKMILNGECGTFNPLLIECLKLAEEKIYKRMNNLTLEKSFDNDTELAIQNLLDNNTINSNLELLEQERVKYNFLVSMSRSIQFEYFYSSDILNIYGLKAESLGIPDIIINPSKNSEFSKTFSLRDFVELKRLIKKTTPEKPNIVRDYYLNLNGNKRLHRMVARSIWIGTTKKVISAIIGKFVDIQEETELKHIGEKPIYDPKTNLYNYDYAQLIVEEYIKEGKKYKKEFNLILVDYSLLKITHQELRDKIIENIVARLKEFAKSNTLVARVSPYEFIYFEEETENLTIELNKLKEALSFDYDGFSVDAKISKVKAGESANLEKLIAKAKKNLS